MTPEKPLTSAHPWTTPLLPGCTRRAAEVDAAVRVAGEAMKGPWGAMTVDERIVLLNKVADRINERFDEFLEAECLDTGKPRSLASHIDIPRGDSVTVEEVLDATELIVPAVEIIDSRYKSFKFDLTSVQADNSSSVTLRRWWTTGEARRVRLEYSRRGYDQ